MVWFRKLECWPARWNALRREGKRSGTEGKKFRVFSLINDDLDRCWITRRASDFTEYGETYYVSDRWDKFSIEVIFYFPFHTFTNISFTTFSLPTFFFPIFVPANLQLPPLHVRQLCFRGGRDFRGSIKKIPRSLKDRTRENRRSS